MASHIDSDFRPVIDLLVTYGPEYRFIETPLMTSPVSDEETCRVPKGAMIQFRKDYQTLAEFAAYVVGVKLTELCPMHMFVYMNALDNSRNGRCPHGKPVNGECDECQEHDEEYDNSL